MAIKLVNIKKVSDVDPLFIDTVVDFMRRYPVGIVIEKRKAFYSEILQKITFLMRSVGLCMSLSRNAEQAGITLKS